MKEGLLGVMKDGLMVVLGQLCLYSLLALALFGPSLLGGVLFWLSYPWTGVVGGVLESISVLLMALGPFLSLALLWRRHDTRNPR